MSQVSMVPNMRSPAAALSRAPSTLSRIHCTLEAEKYGSSVSPVRERTNSSQPCSTNASIAGAVRRHCHTMAL